MKFVEFMPTPLGRGLRVVLGAVLIYVGLAVVQGVGGTILAVAGLLPIVTGIMNLCLLAPLFGVPIRAPSGSAPKT
jgi:hypothetical protein